MSSSNLMSLPVDVPWQRLGTSQDMIDTCFGDRKYPPKWRSSVSLFYYEPPAAEQQFADRIITFIKVSCTITGFQFESKEEFSPNLEISMPPGLLKGDWKWKVFENYRQFFHPYYPCYGAMLQVSVFPKGDFPIEQFPIILDFEPKKREMYESATDAKQFLSNSRTNINVRKGTTTTESEESGWNIAAMLGWAAGAGGGLQGSVSGGYNAKSGTSTETVDITTADYSREKRENYSYTTNLTHMYHLLDSYHLGTNRAMFMIQPRPHIIDSEYSFVNGPRRLEGIQEFFLVVERPKDVPGLCVEATLETAHLGSTLTWQPRIISRRELFESDNINKTADALNLSEDERNLNLESLVHGGPLPMPVPLPWGPPTLVWRGWNQIGAELRVLVAQLLTVGKGYGTVGEPPVGSGPFPSGIDEWNKWADMMFKEIGVGKISLIDWVNISTVLSYDPELDPLEYAEVIYEQVYQHNGELFLTGRTIANCYDAPIYRAKGVLAKGVLAKGVLLPSDFLVWDQRIDISSEMFRPAATNVRRSALANQLSQVIGQQMIESISSPDRLPYGQVQVSEASFVQKALAEALTKMPDNDLYNLKLDEIEELKPEVKQRLMQVFGVQTRKEALRLTVPELRSGLGLDEVDARRLVRQLIGRGPSLQVEPGKALVTVPNVENMVLEVARQALGDASLKVSEEIAYQDALEARDIVLNQYPNAGTLVQRGAAVKLVASSGPVIVPDVVGMNVEKAIARLADSSLGVEQAFVASADQPEGHVVETTPAANVRVPRNSKIVLMIAEATRSRHRKQ